VAGPTSGSLHSSSSSSELGWAYDASMGEPSPMLSSGSEPVGRSEPDEDEDEAGLGPGPGRGEGEREVRREGVGVGSVEVGMTRCGVCGGLSRSAEVRGVSLIEVVVGDPMMDLLGGGGGGALGGGVG